jgi:hypothetical protein
MVKPRDRLEEKKNAAIEKYAEEEKVEVGQINN